MQLTGATVNLTFGDSDTGTFASGPIVSDEVTLAGLSMQEQPFVAVNSTNNNAVLNGGAGIIGLGFPSQRFVVLHIRCALYQPLISPRPSNVQEQAVLKKVTRVRVACVFETNGPADRSRTDGEPVRLAHQLVWSSPFTNGDGRYYRTAAVRSTCQCFPVSLPD